MALDVLIPTFRRNAELAVTLAGLAAQECDFRVIIADQNDQLCLLDPMVEATTRTLRYRGHEVEVLRNPARRGIAQQRQLLFSASVTEQVLMLDDDVWLAPGGLTTLQEALTALECGFVGMPLIGLSHLEDQRPDDLDLVQWWEGKPQPERIEPGDERWQRYRLHNAANPAHLNERADFAQQPEHWRAYRIAWVGGCALYQRKALADVGAWSFWNQLPPTHAGEDVLVQLRLLARFGGAGIMPSYAFHHEVETTLPERGQQAYELLQ